MFLAEWFRRRARDKLRARVLNLEGEVDKRDRRIGILEAERDALAQVIARDRARVAAETAEFSRRRAEQEGIVK